MSGKKKETTKKKEEPERKAIRSDSPATHQPNGSTKNGKESVAEKKPKVKPLGDGAHPIKYAWDDRPADFLTFQAVESGSRIKVRFFQNDRCDLEIWLTPRDYEALAEAIAEPVNG